MQKYRSNSHNLRGIKRLAGFVALTLALTLFFTVFCTSINPLANDFFNKIGLGDSKLTSLGQLIPNADAWEDTTYSTATKTAYYTQASIGTLGYGTFTITSGLTAASTASRFGNDHEYTNKNNTTDYVCYVYTYRIPDAIYHAMLGGYVTFALSVKSGAMGTGNIVGKGSSYAKIFIDFGYATSDDNAKAYSTFNAITRLGISGEFGVEHKINNKKSGLTASCTSTTPTITTDNTNYKYLRIGWTGNVRSQKVGLNTPEVEHDLGTLTLVVSKGKTDSTAPSIAGLTGTQNYYTSSNTVAVADSGSALQKYTVSYNGGTASTVTQAIYSATSAVTSTSASLSSGYGKYLITAYDNYDNISYITVYYNVIAVTAAAGTGGNNYVGTSSTTPTSNTTLNSTVSNQTAFSTFYLYALPSAGYYFTGWTAAAGYSGDTAPSPTISSNSGSHIISSALTPGVLMATSQRTMTYTANFSANNITVTGGTYYSSGNYYIYSGSALSVTCDAQGSYTVRYAYTGTKLTGGAYSSGSSSSSGTAPSLPGTYTITAYVFNASGIQIGYSIKEVTIAPIVLTFTPSANAKTYDATTAATLSGITVAVDSYYYSTILALSVPTLSANDNSKLSILHASASPEFNYPNIGTRPVTVPGGYSLVYTSGSTDNYSCFTYVYYTKGGSAAYLDESAYASESAITTAGFTIVNYWSGSGGYTSGTLIQKHLQTKAAITRCSINISSMAFCISGTTTAAATLTKVYDSTAYAFENNSMTGACLLKVTTGGAQTLVLKVLGFNNTVPDLGSSSADLQYTASDYTGSVFGITWQTCVINGSAYSTTGYSITITGLAITGSGKNNYTYSGETTKTITPNCTISKKTVAAGAITAPALSPTTYRSSDIIRNNTGTDAYASYIPAAGTWTINQSALVGSDVGAGTVTIAALSTSVFAVYQNKTVAGGTLPGKAIGEKDVIIYGFTIGGAAAGNYDFSAYNQTYNSVSYLAVTTTGSITSATITAVTLTASDKVYDNSATATATSYTLSGVVSGDTVTVTYTPTFADKNVVYLVGQPALQTVTARGITINENSDITKAGYNYILAASMYDAASGDYQTTAQAKITPKYFDGSTGGSATAFKYNATNAVTVSYSVAGTGNGALADSLISYIYDGSAKTPSFTLTDTLFPAGLSSGNDYTFAYSDNVNASAAAKITFTGTKNYYGTVTVTFTINKDILSLSFITTDQAISNPYFVYSSDSLFYIYGSAYDQTAVTRTDVDALVTKYATRSTDSTAVACSWSVTSSNGIVPAKPTVKYADSAIVAGQTTLGLSYYSIVVKATPSDTTNYYIDSGANTVTVKIYIIPKSLTITAPNESFIYGEEPKALNAAFSGLVAGETIAQASSVANPRAAKMSVQDIPNYYTYATGGTVFKKDCGDYAITQGTYYAYSISGTTVTYNSAFSEGATAYSGLRNYDVTFVTGNLSITPRYINITPQNQTKIYGDPDPVFTYSVSLTTGKGANKMYALAQFGDGSAADTISPTHVLTRASVSIQDVGVYLITQGGITGAESEDGNYSNYYITFIATSALTVARRDIYFTVDDITQVFGDLTTATYTSGDLSGYSAYSGGQVVMRYSLASGSQFYYGDGFGDSLVRQTPVMSGGTVSQWSNRPIVFDTTFGTFAINYVAETDANSASYKNYNIFVTNNASTKTYIAGELKTTVENSTTSYDDYYVTKRPITIKPTAGQSITYGSAMIPLTYTAYYNGVAAGAEVSGYSLSGEIYAVNGATRIISTLTVVGVAQGGVGAGSYPYSQGSITATANPNYQISFDNSQSFTIAPKSISISAALKKSSYMQEPPADSALTYNTSGLIGTDSFIISLTLGSYLPSFSLSYRPAANSIITLTNEGGTEPSVTFIDFDGENEFTLSSDLAADTYYFLNGTTYYSFVAETAIPAGSVLTFDNETTLILTTFPTAVKSLAVFGYGKTLPAGTVLSFVGGVYTAPSALSAGVYYALVSGEYFYFDLPDLIAGDSITLDAGTMDMLYYWNNSAASLPFRPNAYSPITDTANGITYDIYISYAAWLYAFSASNPNYNVNKNYVISSFDGAGKLERIPKTAVIYPVLNQSVEYGTPIKTANGETGYALKFVALIDDTVDVTSEISGYIFLYGDFNYSRLSVNSYYSFASYDNEGATVNTLVGTGFIIDYQYMLSKAWNSVTKAVVDSPAYFEVKKKDVTVFFRDDLVTNYFGENDIVLDSNYYTVVAGKYNDDLPISYVNGLVGSDTLGGTLSRTVGKTVGYYNITLGSLAGSSYNIYFNTASGAGKYEITRRPVVVHPIAVSAVYAGLNTGVKVDYTITDTLTGITYTSAQATSAANTIVTGYPLSGSLATNAAIQNVGTYTYLLNTLSSSNNINYLVTLDSTVVRASFAATGTTSDSILKLCGPSAPAGTVLGFVNNVYTATSGLAEGTYYINVSGNYYSFTTAALAAGDTLAYTLSAYTVTPKKIVVYVNNAASKLTSVSQIYGEAELSYKPVSTGLVSGDSIAGGFVRAAGTTVGTYVISPDSVLADNLNNNKNYTITYDTANPIYYYNITARPITVTPVNGLSKFYDGTEPAASALLYQISKGDGTTGNPLFGDPLTGSLAKASGVGVGFYDITQGTLTNANNPNYIITFSTGVTYEIKRVSVNFVYSDTPDATGAFTFVYDTAEHTVGYTVKNSALDDFMSLYSAESGYSITCTVLSESSGASTSSFSVTHAGNYTLTYKLKQTANFAAATKEITVKVTPHNLTVTPAAASKVYGSSDPSSAFSTTAAALTGDANVNVNFGRNAGETVGEYLYINAVSDNPDYTVSFGTGSGKFSITPYNLLISASSGVFTKTFGNSDPVLSETFSTGLFSDVVTVTYTRATEAEFQVVGTYSFSSVSGSDSLNYTYSFAANGGIDKFVITRKAITVTADAKSHVYNPSASDAPLTVSVEGLVEGYPLQGFVERTDASNYHAGTYAIIADSILKDNVLNNVNYTIVYVSASYMIERATVTITPASVSAEYGDFAEAGETEVLAYTVSGTVYEGDVLQGALARVNIDSSAPSYLGTVGTYHIKRGTMTNDNNPDYNIIFAENVEYVIIPRIIVLSPKNTSQIYGDVRTVIEIDSIISGTLVESDTLAGEFSVIGDGYNVGTYTIGLGTMDSANVNYSVSLAAGVYYYLINPRQITVVADPVTQTYGDSEKDLSYSISSGNLIVSDSLSGALAREAGTDVGSYPINLGTLANSNYMLTFVSNFYTVSKRLVTVKINDQYIRYGQAIAVEQDNYTVTSGTVVPGDDLGIVISKATGTAMGSYALSAASDNPNYIVTFVRGVFVIRKYDAVITSPYLSLTVLYDGNARKIGATVSSGATVNLYIGEEKVADNFVEPGKYTVTLSAPETDNYYAPENVTVRIIILATSLYAVESGIDATINNKDGFDPDLVLEMKKVSKDDTEINAYLGKNQEIVRGFNIEVIDANQETDVGSTILKIKIPSALAGEDMVTVLLKQNGVYSTREVENIEGYVVLEVDNLSSIAFIQNVSNNSVVFIIVGVAAAIIIGTTLFFAFKRRY